MRLIAADHTTITGGDTVFRYSSRRPLLLMLGGLGGAAAAFVAGYRDVIPDVLAILGGGSLLLLALPARAIYRRTRAPDNWLMACGRRRLLIKVRSYLNADFPRAIPHVLELGWDEVMEIRPAALDVRGQDAARVMQRNTLHYLDIAVAPDVNLDELAKRLGEERALRWKGQAWRHYPVSVIDPDVVRIEWRTPRARVVPSLEEAVRVLRTRAAVGQGTRDLVDLGGVGRPLDPDEARRQIKALADQGHVVDATLLAKRAFGWSTTDARAYVERVGAGDANEPA